MRNISLIGTGLIGSSLALGIQKAHPDVQLIGFDHNQKHLDLALERGIVHQIAPDLERAVREADVIILALPIGPSLLLLEQLATLPLRENVLITDVGSTKEQLVRKAEQVFQEKPVRFIGGHPMAGSHKTGPLAADVHLFENAYYILTPTSQTSFTAIEELEELLSGLGARFVQMSAEEHDLVTSQVSHFPHILASSLMQQTAAYAKEHEMTQHFAAGGFRDMTRIAESEPGMWTSILLSNRAALLERIRDFQERLEDISQVLQDQDQTAIYDFFAQGRDQRKRMEIHKRAGVDSFYDIYLSVPDEENVILRVLEHLQGISVVNIHINEENREDSYGVLQITFKTKEDQEAAVKIIERKTTYTVVIA